jgi:hypothetical protein
MCIRVELGGQVCIGSWLVVHENCMIGNGVDCTCANGDESMTKAHHTTIPTRETMTLDAYLRSAIIEAKSAYMELFNSSIRAQNCIHNRTS